MTFPVAGVFGIPSSADSVVLDINAINPAAKGSLTVYNADSADPGVAAVGLRAGTGTNQESTVPVSSAGTVSLTNHSSGTVDVAASVTGYYTGFSTMTAGDTYVGVGWAPPVINTSTGYNVAQAPIPAGGSLTFQVGGVGGIAAGADVAVLQVNALNATSSGYLTAYAAGGTDPGVSALAYYSDTYYRNLVYVPLSSAGQATLANHGTAPVDVSVYARGYYLPPPASPGGGEYQADFPQMVYGTATAGTTMAANASATFQVTGAGDIPASGVTGVTEDVVVSNPTAMGRLDEGPAGGSKQPVVSFLTGDAGYAGYDNGLVSTLSPTGQETITNDSSGTVDVQVDVTGWFRAPSAPGSPQSVAVTVSGSSATVTWAAPGEDGGSPVTGYTVTASPDNAKTTVGGTAVQATLTGLANAATDSFTVTAMTAAGTSVGGTISPAQVITGTVTTPNGTPVQGEQVSVETNAVDPSSAPVMPSVIGTAVTDANGNWSFTVPSYASLPADAQAAADANGGYLNLDAMATGTATAISAATGASAQYSLVAVGVRSVWVGTATQTQAPAPAEPATAPSMVLRPDGVNVSAQYTPTAWSSTWVSKNNPVATDSNGNIIGDGTNAYSFAPTDAYGFQEVVGNGNYNPSVAADGTDLTNAPVTANDTNCCYVNRYEPNCTDFQTGVETKTSSWTIIGEYHTNWRISGSLGHNEGAISQIGSYLSLNAGAFSFNGYDTYSNETGVTSGEGTPANDQYDSRQVSINLKYWETTHEAENGNGVVCSTWEQWDERGAYQPPGGQYIKQGTNIWGQLSQADIKAGAYWRVDGLAGLDALTNPGWLGYGGCSWYTDLVSGQGVTYGLAADVGGVGIQAETSHSQAVDQGADARPWTCQARNDQHAHASDSRHYFWGYNGALIDHPKSFYLY